MAMATNSSAGVIYSGTLDTTVTISSAQLGGGPKRAHKDIQLKNVSGATIGASFIFNAIQFVYSNQRFGGAGVRASEVDFLLSHDSVKRLSLGATISGHDNVNHSNGFFSASHSVANRSTLNGVHHAAGWNQTKGFAGFSFKTVGHQTDYGWVRLQYTVGANNLVNGLTVIDWGYATGGVSITAGQGIPSAVPEPSTIAMALLAAGAAGVELLRRRRKGIASNPTA